MTAQYPSAVVSSFKKHENTTEVIDAGHPNAIQDEVIAIEQELGANPHLTTSFSASGFSSTPNNPAIQTVNARLNNIEAGLVADIHPQYVKNSTVTTAGDLLYGTGAQTVNRLGIGTQGTVLASNGSAPYWSSASALQGIQGVQGPAGTFPVNYNINTSTATSLQAVNSDALAVVVTNSSSANTYYINSSSSFLVGSTLNIAQIGTGQTTIAGGTGVTVYSTASTFSAPKLRVQYSMATAICIDTNKWIVSGDIA